jgi:hypothetical protein
MAVRALHWASIIDQQCMRMQLRRSFQARSAASVSVAGDLAHKHGEPPVALRSAPATTTMTSTYAFLALCKEPVTGKLKREVDALRAELDSFKRAVAPLIRLWSAIQCLFGLA